MLHDPDILQLKKQLDAKKNPTPEEKFQLVKLYHDRGYTEEALQLLLDMENEHLEFSPTLIALGDLYLEAGMYEKAFNYYCIVSIDDPAVLDRAAAFRYALCNFHMGYMDNAIRFLEPLVGKHPDFEPAYWLLLGIYDALGDQKKIYKWTRNLEKVRSSFKQQPYLGTYLRD